MQYCRIDPRLLLVLAGEVVSEVGPTGKKVKTNVYAAGIKLAEQSEYVYNNTTTESINFEHFDASGMSYRRSMSNGVAIAGAGDYEGAPGEMDPLGGNAGVETPYVEEPQPPPDPGPLNPNYPIYDDAPMIVNGQQVSCTLDGMSIGCGTAMGLLQGGSAIPAFLEPFQQQRQFTFEDRGLGLFTFGFIWGETPVSGVFSMPWSQQRPPQGPQPPHAPPAPPKKKCNVPKFDGLSKELQDRLSKLGITAGAWDDDKNKNDHKLALLNFLGEFEDNGLSLDGFSINITGGPDHLNGWHARFLASSPGAFNRLFISVVGNTNYAPNKWLEHPNFPISFRENPLRDSSQIGFGEFDPTSKSYLTIEIDIDRFNPNTPGGAFLHFAVELLDPRKTNPYQVDNRRFWECE